MKRRIWLMFSLLLANTWISASDIPDLRQAELLNMLKHDCGSCHGLTMRGGLGPSLLPTAMHGKSAGFLAATILYGRPGTPMPPWRPFLSQQEALWLAERIREGVK